MEQGLMGWSLEENYPSPRWSDCVCVCIFFFLISLHDGWYTRRLILFWKTFVQRFYNQGQLQLYSSISILHKWQYKASNPRRHCLPTYRRRTSFPTCLPCQIYSIASSALSNDDTESMISSNRICVADKAAQRSSISCFEPALMPLYWH